MGGIFKKKKKKRSSMTYTLDVKKKKRGAVMQFSEERVIVERRAGERTGGSLLAMGEMKMLFLLAKERGRSFPR